MFKTYAKVCVLLENLYHDICSVGRVLLQKMFSCELVSNVIKAFMLIGTQLH